MSAIETYDALRHFADSWGLLAMVLFFVGVVVRLMLPGAARNARDAAQIPFREARDDKDA